MERVTKGPAHIAATATRLSAPEEFLIICAADSTVDAASEIIPPTTGSAVEITVRAVRAATASTLLVTMPVNPIYPLKRMVNTVINVVAAHFEKR